MHQAAWDWVGRFATDDPITVLDIGGRNVNGSPLDHFPNAQVTALDILPGDGVDIVADAATWVPTGTWDVVLCCETFEHTETWRDILSTAHIATKVGGLFVATMGGPGRAPHSAVHGGPVGDEFYHNVHPLDLLAALTSLGWRDIDVHYLGTPAFDTRCSALR